MISLRDLVFEARDKKKPVVDKEKLDEMASNFDCKEWKMMIGDEGDDTGYHLYLKPQNASRFFSDNDNKAYMFMPNMMDALKKMDNDNELYVIVKTWESIDETSRINNLNISHFALLLPSTGKLFNSLKEAKDFIKENRNCIFIDNPNAKRIKCGAYSLKDAYEQFVKYNKDYKFSKTHPIIFYKQ